MVIAIPIARLAEGNLTIDLVRDPLFENRTIPASIRVAQQTTMDAALALVAQLVGKLEEAERQPAEFWRGREGHGLSYRCSA